MMPSHKKKRTTSQSTPKENTELFKRHPLVNSLYNVYRVSFSLQTTIVVHLKLSIKSGSQVSTDTNVRENHVYHVVYWNFTISCKAPLSVYVLCDRPDSIDVNR